METIIIPDSPVRQLRFAIERINKDLEELQNYPLEGASICMPNTENPFQLYSNIMILDGPYLGIIIPFMVIIPEEYPSFPPNVRIIQSFEDFNSHNCDSLRDENTVHMDFISFTRDLQRNIGEWTSEDSLRTFLVRLQALFLKDGKFEGFRPSAQNIEKLKENLSKFSYYLERSDGTQILHTTKQPYPPIILSEETNTKILKLRLKNSKPKPAIDETFEKPQLIHNEYMKSLIEKRNQEPKLQATMNTPMELEFSAPVTLAVPYAKKLMCTRSRVSYYENPNISYGIPIQATQDKRKRVWPVPVPEIISESAYLAQIGAQVSALSRKLISGNGQLYNVWLPIFINENHLEKSMKYIIQSLKILSYGNDHLEHNITSSNILDALCCILNKMAVGWLMETTAQSIASIETYCQILMLLIKLKNVYRDIPGIIDQQIDKMKESQANRNKDSIKDIGEFLIKLALSKYGLTNSEINRVLIEEYSARQVFWVMKDYPKIKYRYSQRAQDFFKGSLVSHQLFVFNVEISNTFFNPKMLQKLENNYGFPDKETIVAFMERTSLVKEKVTNFQSFFQCVGLTDIINAENDEEMHDYIYKAVRCSWEQGYTKGS